MGSSVGHWPTVVDNYLHVSSCFFFMSDPNDIHPTYVLMGRISGYSLSPNKHPPFCDRLKINGKLFLDASDSCHGSYEN